MPIKLTNYTTIEDCSLCGAKSVSVQHGYDLDTGQHMKLYTCNCDDGNGTIVSTGNTFPIKIGCFNCKHNSGEHPAYKVGRWYKYNCEADYGTAGDCYMQEENPLAPICEGWEA